MRFEGRVFKLGHHWAVEVAIPLSRNGADDAVQRGFRSEILPLRSARGRDSVAGKGQEEGNVLKRPNGADKECENSLRKALGQGEPTSAPLWVQPSDVAGDQRGL